MRKDMVRVVGSSTYFIEKRTALDNKVWWYLFEKFQECLTSGTCWVGKYPTLRDAKYAMKKCDTENALLRGKMQKGDWNEHIQVHL